VGAIRTKASWKEVVPAPAAKQEKQSTKRVRYFLRPGQFWGNCEIGVCRAPGLKVLQMNRKEYIEINNTCTAETYQWVFEIITGLGNEHYDLVL